MKKVYFLVAAGLITAGLAGCNRGWPGCFGRGLFYRTPEAYEDYCEPCDEYETYYDDASAEWVPVAPESLPPVPTEAAPKAKSNSSSS